MCNQFGVEITFVLNADTGYVFNLSNDLYREVIQRFRAYTPMLLYKRCNRRRCVADNFKASCYHPHLEIAQAYEPCEVMIMTSQALNSLNSENRRDAYFEIAEQIRFLHLSTPLSPLLFPWATPFEPWLLHQLASHEKFVGGKISTLDEPHFLYWASMCRDLN